MKNMLLFVEDGMTGKILITIDLDIIKDFDVIKLIVNEILENNHFDNKNNLIIKYGYKP